MTSYAILCDGGGVVFLIINFFWGSLLIYCTNVHLQCFKRVSIVLDFGLRILVNACMGTRRMVPSNCFWAQQVCFQILP